MEVDVCLVMKRCRITLPTLPWFGANAEANPPVIDFRLTHSIKSSQIFSAGSSGLSRMQPFDW